MLQYTTAKELADDDGDGVVTFAPSRPIALRSVWIVVDEESGRYAVGGLPGYPLTILTLPQHLLKKDAEGVLGLADLQGRTAELLIVRPKVGAWRVKGSLGSPADPAYNGKLSLPLVAAVPLDGSTESPKRLKNGDVLAVINTGRLEVFIAEIGK